MLKFTKIKLKNIADIKILFMIKRGIKGGLTEFIRRMINILDYDPYNP